MRILPIVKIGNPILRKKLRPLSRRFLKDKKFHQLLHAMTLTMINGNGVGLAANQVGKDMAVIILENTSNRRYPGREAFALEIYVNPRILRASREKAVDWEGCLSIPGYRGLVPRPRDVVLEAWSVGGERIRKKIRGFHARVIQHEVDHINGRCYLDRMRDFRSFMDLDSFNKKFGVRIRDKN